jgi:hypothetical protein
MESTKYSTVKLWNAYGTAVVEKDYIFGRKTGFSIMTMSLPLQNFRQKKKIPKTSASIRTFSVLSSFVPFWRFYIPETKTFFERVSFWITWRHQNDVGVVVYWKDFRVMISGYVFRYSRDVVMHV